MSITRFSLLMRLLLTVALLSPLPAPAETGKVLESASELDYPPFSMVRPDGSAAGFSVDLLQAAAGAVGMRVRFSVGPWHEIRRGLEEGWLDVLPLVSYSEDRDEVFDFTAPYLRMRGTIFVRRGEKSIRSESDLKGRGVLVMRGDTAHEYALRQDLTDRLTLTDSFEEAMQRLSRGEHDAVIIQQVVGHQLVKKLGLGNLVDVGAVRERSLKPVDTPLLGFEQKFCFAVREGNRKLQGRLNEGLAIVIANGTYHDLYNKWFEPILPRPPVPLSRILRYSLLLFGPAVFLMAVGGLWYLRREVSRKTLRLRDLTTRLRLATASARAGVWDWSIETNEMVWDDRMLELYGLTRETFPGGVRAWEQGLHPEDSSRAVEECQAALRGERGFDTEFRVRRPEGTVVHIKADGVVLRSPEGKPLRMIGLNTDITGRKRTEEESAERERYLRTIVQTTADGFWVVDLKGRFRDVNETYCRMSGYTKEELLRLSIPDIDAFDTPEAVAERMDRMIRSGSELFTTSHRRKDGSVFDVEVSSTYLDIRGGCFVCFCRDITERKHAQAKLLETNRELEETTARAHEMALKAELSSIAKSEFLANMSHEIRTPMNGVIGMTGLLLETELTEEQRRYAETVRGSAESLLSLINNILDFSKIEARKLDMEVLDFDLAGLLEDFAAALAIPAHEKGLEMLCSADPAVPVLLRGDPGRLRQVLSNLAGNAVKFTHSGEVAVRVAVEEETDAEVLLRFSVRDTGIGIPQGKIGILFEKFTQADTSTTRRYGGSGLGLAISKQLAELMGGEIGVASEERRGSEFWFTARFSKQGQGTERGACPQADLREVRALIVDDNGTSREILGKWLSSWGMRPVEAPDGEAALETLRRAVEETDPFRIALIDMQMPGMDGEMLCREVKKDPRLEGTLMIMLTSLGARGQARRCQEIGFSGYATKPIRNRELRGMLATAIGSTEPGVPAARTPIGRPAGPDTTPPFVNHRARILLAEDNITNQQVAVGILKRLGLKADAVANGVEVMRALENIPYDLVLMDVQMPEMDGLEATHRIRRSADPLRRIPIIAMTAHAMKGDREKCLKAGMNDYVSKPVTRRTLAETLARWLPQEGEDGKDGGQRGRRTETLEHRKAQPSPTVFDRAGMLARLEDEELANEVARGFLEDIPGQIETLGERLLSGDLAGAERQAHSIKSAAAYVGGERLREIAFGMEKATRDGQLSTSRELLPGLRAEFARLRAALEEELQPSEQGGGRSCAF